MNDHLVTFVTITPRPEYFDQSRDAVLGIIERTRAEVGCGEFVLHEGREFDGNLYLYESFVDQSALDEHFAKDFVQEVLDSYAEWLDRPIELLKLRRFES